MIDICFEAHTITPVGIELSKQVREKATELLELLHSIPSNREMSLAKTKLEECVMWANKNIAKEVK